MLMIPSLEACKKRKRRSKVYGFHSFGEPGYPILAQGPFRDNIRLFLQQCAELESYIVQGMPIWCTLLVHDNRSLVLPLYSIAENVKTSDTPFCDHCPCTGWSNHFVSKRKYHMIIPMDDDWNKPLDDGILDLSTHLLHGLIHCNGFAHMLCINGLEELKVVLNISVAESSWIFGIGSALIFEPGNTIEELVLMLSYLLQENHS